MEGPKKNKFEDLRADEQALIRDMNYYASTMEDYIINLNEKFPRKQLLELDDILNQPCSELLHKLDTERLHNEFIQFGRLLNVVNQNLAVYMSEFFDSFVTDKIDLSEEEISSLRADVDRVKNIIIPRLKKFGLNGSIDELNDSILGLEIKLANDSGVSN